MRKGEPYGMVFSSMQAMNVRRIEAGIFDSGSDFDSSMTPFESGLENFIDLGKKGFMGRCIDGRQLRGFWSSPQ